MKVSSNELFSLHYLSNILNLCQFSLCQAGAACLKKKRAEWLAQVQDFIKAVWNLASISKRWIIYYTREVWLNTQSHGILKYNLSVFVLPFLTCPLHANSRKSFIMCSFPRRDPWIAFQELFVNNSYWSLTACKELISKHVLPVSWVRMTEPSA